MPAWASVKLMVMKAKKNPHPKKSFQVLLLPVVLGSDTYTRELHPKGFIMRIHIYTAERKTETSKAFQALWASKKVFVSYVL